MILSSQSSFCCMIGLFICNINWLSNETGYTRVQIDEGAYLLRVYVMPKDKMNDLEKEILLYLAKNRSGYYYGIHKYLCSKKKTLLNLIQTWRALKKLKSLKMIKSYKNKRIRTGGQKKGPYYSLTTVGLLRLFTYEKEISKYADDIAKIHKNKVPLIFRHWRHFKKQEADKKVIQAIKSYYKFYVAELVYELAKSKKMSLLKSKKLKNILKSKKLEDMDKWVRFKHLEILPEMVKKELPKYILFYYMPLLNLPPISQITDPTQRHVLEYFWKRWRSEMFEWVRIWHSEFELKQFMNEHLDKYEEKVAHWFMYIKELKEFIRTLETSRKS